MKCRYHLLGIVFLNYLSTTLNAEWPQFLGPQRNGIADKSTQIKIPNATGEFSQLWKISAGDGHAGPVVVDQKVLLHHRYGDEEILEAFDTNTGKSIWKNSHPCRHSGSYDRNLGTKINSNRPQRKSLRLRHWWNALLHQLKYGRKSMEYRYCPPISDSQGFLRAMLLAVSLQWTCNAKPWWSPWW